MGLVTRISWILSMVLLSAASAHAKDIVHDSEYYFLKRQHAEKWAQED